MGLKENIRKYRLKNDLTLDEVAKKVGVTLQTIQKYEKGTITNIPQDKIEKLAEIFQITPSELMGWNEDEYVSVHLDENFANEIQKVVYKYSNQYKKYLKDTCTNLSIFNEKLTDKFFINKSYEISTDISNQINYESYNNWLSHCIENIKKYNDPITINDIFSEINNELDHPINDIINLSFSNIIENIYNEVHNIEVPDVLTPSYFEYFKTRNETFMSSIYDIIEQSEVIRDLTNDLFNVVENKIFSDILKEIVSNLLNQFNTLGQQKVLDYIRDLQSIDYYKKVNNLHYLKK